MNLKIRDIMSSPVITLGPDVSVGRARVTMRQKGIHAMPVLSAGGRLVGIVSTADLAKDIRPTRPVDRVMTTEVVTIPPYKDVSEAARTMRRKHVHHLVVTQEDEVLGMLSSYDLLALVENRRFVSKQAPTPATKSKRKSRRQG